MFPCRYGRRNSMNPCCTRSGGGSTVGRYQARLVGVGLVVDAQTRVVCMLFRNSHIDLLMCVGGLLWQVFGLLVPVGWALLLYTSGLSTQCSAGGLNPQRGGKPHLETCFPLRCVQRLSLPNVANQPCTWRYNWHTRGSSIPVLSY